MFQNFFAWTQEYWLTSPKYIQKVLGTLAGGLIGVALALLAGYSLDSAVGVVIGFLSVAVVVLLVGEYRTSKQ